MLKYHCYRTVAIHFYIRDVSSFKELHANQCEFVKYIATFCFLDCWKNLNVVTLFSCIWGPRHRSAFFQNSCSCRTATCGIENEVVIGSHVRQLAKRNKKNELASSIVFFFSFFPYNRKLKTCHFYCRSLYYAGTISCDEQLQFLNLEWMRDPTWEKQDDNLQFARSLFNFPPQLLTW